MQEVPPAVNEFKGLVIWNALASFISLIADKDIAASFFWGMCLPLGLSFNVGREFVSQASANIEFSEDDVSCLPEFKSILEAVQCRREASTYVKATVGLRFLEY